MIVDIKVVVEVGFGVGMFGFVFFFVKVDESEFFVN